MNVLFFIPQTLFPLSWDFAFWSLIFKNKINKTRHTLQQELYFPFMSFHMSRKKFHFWKLNRVK